MSGSQLETRVINTISPFRLTQRSTLNSCRRCRCERVNKSHLTRPWHCLASALKAEWFLLFKHNIHFNYILGYEVKTKKNTIKLHNFASVTNPFRPAFSSDVFRAAVANWSLVWIWWCQVLHHNYRVVMNGRTWAEWDNTISVLYPDHIYTCICEGLLPSANTVITNEVSYDTDNFLSLSISYMYSRRYKFICWREYDLLHRSFPGWKCLLLPLWALYQGSV